MTDHTAPELKRLHEFLGNQLADPTTAPAVVFIDPDVPPSEWEKQYSMDVVYIRADLHRAEVDALVAELEHFRSSGIVEIAIRNPSVMEYMKHWEARAEKAKADVAALRAHTEAAVRRALAGADLEAQLAKSMAHFLTVDEWKGYKRGVQEYAAKVRALADNPAQFIEEQ